MFVEIVKVRLYVNMKKINQIANNVVGPDYVNPNGVKNINLNNMIIIVCFVT
jgi:hypothetical protein